VGWIHNEISALGRDKTISLTTGQKEKVDEKAQYMSGELFRMDLESNLNPP
jgi:hypothetical protein